MTLKEVREIAERKKAIRKRKNSRQKGARGEREVAHVLQALGLAAYRGQQFRGGTDSPDVVCPDLPNIHFEVKLVRGGDKTMYKWLEQAIGDAGEKVPVVVHRSYGREWIAILPFDQFLKLVTHAL